MTRLRRLTLTICAFHLGFSLGTREAFGCVDRVYGGGSASSKQLFHEIDCSQYSYHGQEFTDRSLRIAV